MKLLVRSFLFNMFAIWFTSQVFPTLVVAGGWQTMLLGGLVLSLLMLLVAPLLKILFIPINIITFGLLSWIVNVIVLVLLTVFVPDIQVAAHTFPSVTWGGFVVPSIHAAWWAALVISSLAITGISNLLHEVSEH
jgi:putative membrane protein